MSMTTFLSPQEVETEQYFTLFLPALKERGYDGFFSPKSRAKIMSEQEKKHVDGCAIFFKTEKWVKETKHNGVYFFNTQIDKSYLESKSCKN